MAPEETLQRAVAEPVAAGAQRLAQFLDGRIGHLIEELLDQSSLCLDPAGATIPAEWAGLGATLLPLQCPPTADTGWADAEPRRSLPMAGTISNRGENAHPKIDRQGFRHARRPPFPGRQFESHLRRVGYPLQFSQEGFRSSLTEGAHRDVIVAGSAKIKFEQAAERVEKAMGGHVISIGIEELGGIPQYYIQSVIGAHVHALIINPDSGQLSIPQSIG